MALKLFSFDNAVQGLNYSVQNSYVLNNTLNQYTGVPGVPLYFSLNLDGTTIGSDGYLYFNAGSNQAMGMYALRLSDVRGASATQSWFGFRHLALVVQMTGNLLRVMTGFGTSNASLSLTWAELRAAGGGVLNVEDYIELFLDQGAGTYQIWWNGVLIKTAAVTFPITSTSCIYVGPNSGGLGGVGWFGIRDMYWMDIDGVDTARLGPIRSSKASLVISGSEYTVTGAADVQTALTTALQNPPTVTPNALSPADKQPLTAALTTAVPANSRILAIQGQISVAGNTVSPTAIDLAVTDGTHTSDMGQVTLANSAMLYNQTPPSLVRTAPDGSALTVAKINALSLVATPQ